MGSLQQPNRLSGKSFAAGILMLLGTALSALGQSFSFSVNSNNVVLPVSAADYDLATGDGTATALSATMLAIRSNNDSWTLSMRAQTSTFAFSPLLGDANPVKPASNLSVRTGSTGSWMAVSTASKVFATGPKGNYTAPDRQLPVDYMLSTSLETDPPGNYSLTLIWTLTQP